MALIIIATFGKLNGNSQLCITIVCVLGCIVCFSLAFINKRLMFDIDNTCVVCVRETQKSMKKMWRFLSFSPQKKSVASSCEIIENEYKVSIKNGCYWWHSTQLLFMVTEFRGSKIEQNEWKYDKNHMERHNFKQKCPFLHYYCFYDSRLAGQFLVLCVYVWIVENDTPVTRTHIFVCVF